MKRVASSEERRSRALLSSPAQAGDPVFTAASACTGCPAFAGHDGEALLCVTDSDRSYASHPSRLSRTRAPADSNFRRSKLRIQFRYVFSRRARAGQFPLHAVRAACSHDPWRSSQRQSPVDLAMNSQGILPVNFTISDAARQAADKIRAEYDAAMPDDPAAVLCVAWGIAVPHAGPRSEGVVVGFYQRSMLSEIADGIQEASGVELVFFTTEEHRQVCRKDSRFFARAPFLPARAVKRARSTAPPAN